MILKYQDDIERFNTSKVKALIDEIDAEIRAAQ